MREPAGIPTGGRFASFREESRVTLAALREQIGHRDAAQGIADRVHAHVPAATHATISWDEDRPQLSSVLTPQGAVDAGPLSVECEALVSQIPDTVPATYDPATAEFTTDPEYDYLSGRGSAIVIDLGRMDP